MQSIIGYFMTAKTCIIEGVNKQDHRLNNVRTVYCSVQNCSLGTHSDDQRFLSNIHNIIYGALS